MGQTMLACPEMVAPKPKTEQRHPRKNPPMTLHLRIGVRLGVRLGVRRKTLAYVDSIAEKNDLILSMDNLWTAIKSNKCGQYEKPNQLKSVVFSMRDHLLDIIKTRYGKWDNAYIIGGYPLISERESLIDSLGVDRAIFIDTPKEECLLNARARGEMFVEFVEQWFERFTR